MSHGTCKKYMLASGLLCLASSALANVNNASFESWSANTPASWSTIDSGISLSANSNVVYSGNYSAQVVVNTGTQSNTDLQQLVDVVAGETYEFSAWVYHTEGGVKARLVVDGYQGYSNSALTNQWQQISYQYTASATTSINIGLRFYDVTGFDGSEVVYVDNFAPSTGATPPP